MVGSINTEIIERAGGRNVARGRRPARAGARVHGAGDRCRPEIILTWDRNFFDHVGKDPLWAGIRAVREKRVYLAPTAPFGWIDRPPSLNRIIGLSGWRACSTRTNSPHDLRETTGHSIVCSITWTSSEPELDSLIAWSKGQAPSAQTPGR